jgi:hypothetical protein
VKRAAAFVVREHGPNPWDRPEMIRLLAEAVLISIQRQQNQPALTDLGTGAITSQEAPCTPSIRVSCPAVA